MLKSAELPRVNVCYKAKSADYDAVCIMKIINRQSYALYSMKREGRARRYDPITKGMGLKEARDLLTDFADLKQDLIGNMHLIEW